MGKQNRQRRREKQNRRAQAERRPQPVRAGSSSGPASPAEGVALLAEAIRRGRPDLADGFVAGLAGQWTERSDAGGVPQASSAALATAVGAAWEHGWQPADLLHAFGRKLAAPDRRLLVGIIEADVDRLRAHVHADPAWFEAEDDVVDERPAGRSDGVVGSWTRAEGLSVVDALYRSGELLALLWNVPTIPAIGRPPSAWGAASSLLSPRRRPPSGSVLDDRMLARVRALLAKAESTEFVPEAEALTEKAQQLMARYAIDHAMIAGAERGAGGVPESRRVLIHDPYAKGKATLLTEVGRANRCQTVWSKDFGFCTVFGFATDLAVTEILFTSLVSQCSTAMQAASKTLASPRSFRESFVLSFAIHIGTRLGQATASTVADAVADHGDALLPVLASRNDEVEAARSEAFPRTRATGIRSVDRRGWAAGQVAAELAHLDAGQRLTR